MAKKIKFLEVSDTFINDRSDPHQVISMNPAFPVGHPERETTRLQQSIASWVSRTDIAMVNLSDSKGNIVEQPCVYGYKDGSIEWSGTQYMFTIKEQKEIVDIVTRLVKVSKEHPTMGKYLLDLA